MNKIAKQENFIGKILCYIGFVIIGFGILGFILTIGGALELAEYSELGTLAISSAIATPLISAVIAFLFFAASEIIRQLTLITTGTGKDTGSIELPKL